MKKYLHGKRYLRSRKTVQIGRMKKMTHKFSKFTFTMCRTDWSKITKELVKAFGDMAIHISRMAHVMKKVR
jgi:hypothetical protein